MACAYIHWIIEQIIMKLLPRKVSYGSLRGAAPAQEAVNGCWIPLYVRLSREAIYSWAELSLHSAHRSKHGIAYF